MEEILMEREREREQGLAERAQVLAKQKELHEATSARVKNEHDDELEIILEERERDREHTEVKMARLQRTQTELEQALGASHSERESEEMQAHEAINTSCRDVCSQKGLQ